MPSNLVILYIEIAVLAVSVLGVNFYLLALYTSPDDKNTAWLPKIVTLIAMSSAWITVLLMPIDVSHRGDYTEGTELFESDLVWTIFLNMNTCLGLVVLPFCMFWYEGYEPEKSLSAQLLPAGVYTSILVLTYLAITISLWHIMGTAHFPVTQYTASFDVFYNATKVAADGIAPVPEVTVAEVTIPIRVSFFVFMTAMVGLLGWLLIAIFGGVGMGAFPMDLIMGFLNRPRPIKLPEYTRRKQKLVIISQELLEKGEALEMEHQAAKKKTKRAKRETHDFRLAVSRLKIEYEKIEEGYKQGGGSIVEQFLLLLLGFACGALALAWFVHVVMHNITGVDSFLNNFFVMLGNIWGFLPIIFYAILVLFLLASVVKGFFKFGVRFLWIPLYPMIKNDTLMNAFCFNAALICISSIAVVQFAARSFDHFANDTAGDQLFNVYIGSLPGMSHIYKGFQFLFLGTMLSGVVFTLLCTKGL